MFETDLINILNRQNLFLLYNPWLNNLKKQDWQEWCTNKVSISAHTYAHIYMFGFSTNANMPSCSDCYFIWFKSENFAI